MKGNDRMSLGNDFLKLINELWDIEQFDMWNPKEHSAIAYLLDQSYSSEAYQGDYIKWLSLAQRKEFNEFAWEISQAIVNACKKDKRIGEEEIEDLEELLDWQHMDYDSKCLSGFGLVKEKYVPEWFFELFHSYIKLEETKRENMVMEYLVKKCSMTEKRARDAYDKLHTQHDILNEFYFYVRNERFVTFSPITVEGISAQQLHKTTYLSPIGAYNYLIYLRESPMKALEDLKRGLPRK